jgi:hypothetical protein
MVVKNAVWTGKVVVKGPSSSDGVVIEDQLSNADLVKDPILCDGEVVKDVFFSGKDVVKEQLVFDIDDILLSNVSVVEHVLYSEGDIVNDPLWSDGNVVGVTVPSGVQCTEVGNSVLCSTDAMRNHLAGDMGLEDVSLLYHRYEPAYCNFCIMHHSVTCKVQSKGAGIREVDRAKDSRLSKMERGEDFSLCSVEQVKYFGSCKECATEQCEDIGWKAQGRTCLKNEDSRCNWRRRRRNLVWWLLLLFLGAAPLASGQLRPVTDISISRAGGGELCVG